MREARGRRIGAPIRLKPARAETDGAKGGPHATRGPGSWRALRTGPGQAFARISPARTDDAAALFAGDPDDPAFSALRAAETTGRPLSAKDFVTDLERRLGRPIARRAPGRKPPLGKMSNRD
jgi:hypothetical protein